MPLPTSGPISLRDIAVELGAVQNFIYGLQNELNASSGLDTSHPIPISRWYGYTNFTLTYQFELTNNNISIPGSNVVMVRIYGTDVNTPIGIGLLNPSSGTSSNSSTTHSTTFQTNTHNLTITNNYTNSISCLVSCYQNGTLKNTNSFNISSHTSPVTSISLGFTPNNNDTIKINLTIS